MNVTFTPKYAGTRYGAAQLLDTSGKLLASALLYGTGVGPQLAFPGNAIMQTLGGGSMYPELIAVDGSGNAYIRDENNSEVVEKIPPGCTSSSCITTLGGGFNSLYALTVDGNGTVYVVDDEAVKQVSPQCVNAGCVAE